MIKEIKEAVETFVKEDPLNEIENLREDIENLDSHNKQRDINEDVYMSHNDSSSDDERRHK